MGPSGGKVRWDRMALVILLRSNKVVINTVTNLVSRLVVLDQPDGDEAGAKSP